MPFIDSLIARSETWISKATEYYDTHNRVVNLLPGFAQVHLLDFSLVLLSVLLFAWILIKKLVNS